MITLSMILWGGGALAVLAALATAYFTIRRNAEKRAAAKQAADRLDAIKRARNAQEEVDQMAPDARREELKRW